MELNTHNLILQYDPNNYYFKSYKKKINFLRELFEEILKFKEIIRNMKKHSQSSLKYSNNFIEILKKLENLLKTVNEIYIIEITHINFLHLDIIASNNGNIIKFVTKIKDLKVTLSEDLTNKIF